MKNVEVPEEVPALKKASSRGSRSSVWEHFSDPTVDKRTTCKHCKGSYKYTGGTTNLINHLKSLHPAFVDGNSIFKQAVKVELSDIERTVFGTSLSERLELFTRQRLAVSLGVIKSPSLFWTG